MSEWLYGRSSVSATGAKRLKWLYQMYECGKQGVEQQTKADARSLAFETKKLSFPDRMGGNKETSKLKSVPRYFGCTVREKG